MMPVIYLLRTSQFMGMISSRCATKVDLNLTRRFPYQSSVTARGKPIVSGLQLLLMEKKVNVVGARINGE